jgi:hypothetical protein
MAMRKRRNPARLDTLFSHPKMSLLAVGAIAVLASCAAWRWYDADRTLADLEARGFPTSLKGLDDSYEWPPDADNAALAFLAAYDALDDPGYVTNAEYWGGETYVDRWTPVPQSAMDEMADYIASNTKSFELLFEGAARTQSRYPIDFNQGFEASGDHLRPLRDLARTLSAYAIYTAENGDPNEATKAISALFSVGESLRNEPTSIAQLVRVAFLSIAIGAFEEVLARAEWDEVSLANLAAAIQRVNIHGSTRTALRENVVIGLVYTNSDTIGAMMANSATNLEFVLDLLDSWWWRLTRAKGERLAVALDTASVAEASVKPYPQAVEAMDKIMAELEADLEARPDRMTLSQFAIPMLELTFVFEAHARAQLLLLETVVAVERHRVATGELPTSLEAISTEYLNPSPVDPFDGQPIRYVNTDVGYRVYSIGQNEVDDGGVQGAYRHSGDVVMEVRR